MKMNLLKALSMLLVLSALGACSIEPWVKPYERANLADPIMSFSRDPVAATYDNHVHETREGARGAGSASGGGCGCN